METLPNSKAFWRSHYLALRSQLTTAWMQQAQQQWVQQAASLHFPPQAYVFTYMPMAGRNEPDPLPWLQACLKQQPNLKLVYPLMTDARAGIMEAVLPHAHTPWNTHAWGMQQPERYQVVPPEKIQVVITPLLAVDRQGHRVGYGKGFYDRFFARCAPHTLRVGISWFEPVSHIADIGPNDIPLSHCVTPQQLYVF